MKIVLALLTFCAAAGLHVGNAQREPNEMCTLLNKCPAALEIIRRRGDLKVLERKVCGHEGRYTKVWCKVPCVTPDRENGICTPIDNCDSFQDLVRRSDTSNLETKRYLQKFRCDKSSPNVHVCCTQASSNVETTSARPDDKGEQCGVQNDQYKVVFGSIAELGQFPWLALLQYNNKGTKQFNCGGTLINRRYVLTAAHCTDGYGGRLTNVVLGEHNVTSLRDCIHTYCAPDPKVVRVESVTQHPGWVNAASRFYHDLALIRLAEDVEYNDFVQPICLPPSDYSPANNEKFTVAGWGQTENGSSSDVKRYAPILLQRKQSCLATISIPLNEGQLCVGGGSSDSCRGDSGGPLMKGEIVNGLEVWQITGVVSFGYNAPCATIGRPGIYTYVPNYVDWIKENSRL